MRNKIFFLIIIFFSCNKEPLDSDKDNVIDEIDECPLLAGSTEFNGCPSYTLSVNSNPIEGGSTDVINGTYKHGSSISIVAFPSNEYTFHSWQGYANTQPTLEIIMNSNKNITANFIKKKYTLSINVEGEGSITQEIIKEGSSKDYNSGTILELTANPNNNWEFLHWKGSLTGNKNPTQLTIDNNKQITAVFKSITDPIIGKWNLATEKWVSDGSWPDGQARGCYQSDDEGEPDELLFTNETVVKTVWECDKDGNLITEKYTLGPLKWIYIGRDSQGYEIYEVDGERSKILFNEAFTAMAVPFEDGKIEQIWARVE